MKLHGSRSRGAPSTNVRYRLLFYAGKYYAGKYHARWFVRGRAGRMDRGVPVYHATSGAEGSDGDVNQETSLRADM